MRRALAVLAGVALAGAAPADAGPAKRRTVKVGDNFFAPAQLRAARGTVVTWRWPSSAGEVGDVHDVELDSAPKGVKRFASDPAASDYTFKRRFTKPGRYRVICTLHEEMAMRLTIR